MKEFFKNNFGYIIGILLTPITWKLFETFKGKNNQDCIQKIKKGDNEMQQNIFTQIMNLIETNTDIPRLEKDIEEWTQEEKENLTIYEIYKTASKARKI